MQRTLPMIAFVSSAKKSSRVRFSRDPYAITAALIAVALLLSAAIANANALIPAQESSVQVQLDVPITTAITPGWTAGNTGITLPDIALPGETRNSRSAGWRLSTSWTNGYDVRVSSTSSPALRGENAVDGSGATDSFSDFTTARCPCTWDTKKAKKGVFGYSAQVSTISGAPAAGAGIWGNASARKWRGLTRAPFTIYSTPGGSGEYDMTLLMRTEIPDGSVQASGTYRASVVVSSHPML